MLWTFVFVLLKIKIIAIDGRERRVEYILPYVRRVVCTKGGLCAGCNINREKHLEYSFLIQFAKKTEYFTLHLFISYVNVYQILFDACCLLVDLEGNKSVFL